MFKELGPLLRQRTVVLILTRLEDDTIRVNVIPRKLNESENDAFTTPLSVAGTAEESGRRSAFRTGPVCRRPSRAEEHARNRQGADGGGSQGRKGGGPVEDGTEDRDGPDRAIGG